MCKLNELAGLFQLIDASTRSSNSQQIDQLTKNVSFELANTERDTASHHHVLDIKTLRLNSKKMNENKNYENRTNKININKKRARERSNVLSKSKVIVTFFFRGGSVNTILK